VGSPWPLLRVVVKAHYNMLTVTLMVLSAMIGTLGFIFPAAVLLLPCSLVLPTLGLYRTTVDAVQHWWLKFAVLLIEWVGGMSVTMSGDVQPHEAERATILISNHNCRLDWMFLWCLCLRMGWLRTLTIMLKAPLKKVPFFGWACQAFHFVFLARNDREGDLATIGSLLRYLCALGAPPVVLCFPEGTDLSPENLAKSNAFATKKGLAPLKHLLHPRTAGFIAAERALGEHLDAVYDVTISYVNHPCAPSKDPRPDEKSIFAKGKWPKAVHFHVARTAAAELRKGGSDDAALSGWLENAWAAKERRLEQGNPPADSPHPRDPTSQLACAAVGWALCAACVAWSLYSSWLPWLGALFGCVGWGAAMKLFGGLGNLERQLCEARVLAASGKAKRA